MKKYILLPYDSATEQHTAEEQLTVDEILSAIPNSFTNKARALLQHIKRSKALQWNERGEITLPEQEQPLQGSHIVDLLKYSLIPYKNFTPLGHAAFYKALLVSNIPQSLIIQKGTGSLPPPGVPERTTSVKQNKAWIWHKM